MNRKAVANELIKIAKKLLKTDLTDKEEDLIIEAAKKTWQAIGPDAGTNKVGEAIDTVLDFGIEDNLDHSVIKKFKEMNLNDLQDLLKKHQSRWI